MLQPIVATYRPPPIWGAPIRRRQKARIVNRMPEGLKYGCWKRTDTIAQAWEPRFAAEVVRQLHEDGAALQALIAGHKAQVDWQQVEHDYTYYFEAAGKERWRKAFVPLIQGVITQQSNAWNAQFGMRFDVRNLFAEEWYRKYTLVFADNATIYTRVKVRAILAQATREGWSIPRTQERMTLLFQQWIDGGQHPEDFDWLRERMPPRRTEMIARTETMRAANAGSEALFRDWGTQYKEWYSTPDSRTREAHQVGAAWGQDPLIAPIDGAFTVGGEALAYPGDPAGSPGNTINCRCTVLPVIPEERPAGEEPTAAPVAERAVRARWARMDNEPEEA